MYVSIFNCHLLLFEFSHSPGRRSCVGEVHSQKGMFLFYTRLIQNFRFRLPDGAPRPKLEAQWLTVFCEGYQICAEPRE